MVESAPTQPVRTAAIFKWTWESKITDLSDDFEDFVHGDDGICSLVNVFSG